MERARKYLIAVSLFSITMAYIEAAIVVYLRALYEINDLLVDMPVLPDQYTPMEIGREAATLMMLIIIGWISGQRALDRFGYAIFAFGMWDIFYYVWLVVFIDWPESLFDWDLLFLIPLPWWGPVLSPLLIACLLVVGGGLVVIKAAQGESLRFTLIEWSLAGVGVLLALYVFMFDALQALPGGIEAISEARPTAFNWPLFIIALAAMSLPAARALVRGSTRYP
ncbi:MAG: hypothetical protein QGD92_06840 [Gammaproteobacteria bacterium]|nr:hypothetical protein [Gammaproteobacteria bacterium]